MIGNTVNSVNQIECHRAADDDALRDYVAGKLSPEAAEEFEQHLFECDACADEVQRAIEIRAALRTPARRAAGGRWGVGLAIAATIGAIAFGLWQVELRRQPLAPPPLRGSAHEITATGTLNGATFTAIWKPVANARSYRVQIFNAIGEPVTFTETGSTTFSATIGAARKSEPRYWKVQALDDDRVVIAASALMKIDGQ